MPTFCGHSGLTTCSKHRKWCKTLWYYFFPWVICMHGIYLSVFVALSWTLTNRFLKILNPMQICRPPISSSRGIVPWMFITSFVAVLSKGCSRCILFHFHSSFKYLSIIKINPAPVSVRNAVGAVPSLCLRFRFRSHMSGLLGITFRSV